MPAQDCAPATTLQPVDTTLAVPPVTITAVTDTSGGQSMPAFNATWTAITNNYVIDVEIQWAKAASLAPGQLPDSVITPKDALSVKLKNGVLVGQQYAFRWRARGLNDKVSDWSSTFTLTANGTDSTSTATGVVGQGPWATEQTPVTSVINPNANLIYNPEARLGTQGWTITGGWVAAQIGGAKFFSLSTAPAATMKQTIAQAIDPTKKYTLSASIDATGVTVGFGRVIVNWKNSGGTILGTTILHLAAGLADVKAFVGNITPPATTVAAEVVLDNVEATTYTVIRLTKLKLEMGAVNTVFTDNQTHGASYDDFTSMNSLKPGEAGANVTETRVASAITSQGPLATAALAIPSLVVNPDPANLFADPGMTDPAIYVDVSTMTHTFTDNTTGAYSSEKILNLTLVGTGKVNVLQSKMTQVLPGFEYYILANLFAAGGGGGGAKLGAQFYKTNGPGSWSTVGGLVPVLANSTIEKDVKSAIITVPSNANRMMLVFEKASVAGWSAEGSCSGTTLTITSMNTGVIEVGDVISNGGWTASTSIVSQLTGTTGGAGTYQVNNSQTRSQQTVNSSTGTGTSANVSFAGVAIRQATNDLLPDKSVQTSVIEPDGIITATINCSSNDGTDVIEGGGAPRHGRILSSSGNNGSICLETASHVAQSWGYFGGTVYTGTICFKAPVAPTTTQRFMAHIRGVAEGAGANLIDMVISGKWTGSAFTQCAVNHRGNYNSMTVAFALSPTGEVCIFLGTTSFVWSQISCVELAYLSIGGLSLHYTDTAWTPLQLTSETGYTNRTTCTPY